MKRKGYSPVCEDQLSLFAEAAPKVDAEAEKRAAKYRIWLSLPDTRLIRADDEDRRHAKSILQQDYCFLWRRANHVCPGIPENKYIWLNYVEPKEYWVINDVGNPCGEHVEICPYCGADLTNGFGDVELKKADDSWWVIHGLHKKAPTLSLDK